MDFRRAAASAILIAGIVGADSQAVGADEIINYREYSDSLSSSGQPTEEQLRTLQKTDFERVIFLAFSDSDGSLANEDRLVRDLGMDYTHIPVVWEAPAKRDFYTFTAIMRQFPKLKTLVHCQVNYRASTFSFLYRVIYEDVPMDRAKDDLYSVWVPDITWRSFIFSILEENGVSPHCDSCLWETE